MTSVGTITFHESINFGAILQAYAIQQVLMDLGHNTEIIDYLNPRRKRVNFSVIRLMAHYTWNQVVARVLVGTDRKRKTEEFRRQHLRLSARTYCSAASIHADPPLYDAYITGSDQVWNPINNANDSTYFLTFAPSGRKRISYAASFGVAEIRDEFARGYAEWLRQIQCPSVREFEGKRIVHELTGSEPVMVLDPTLLLGAAQWNRIAVPSENSGPYILCYYMPGDKLVNKSITGLARQVAKKTGWRVIAIGEKEYQRLNPFRHSIFSAGPAEFVGLLRNASYVITNSFHGVAFSIIYRIPFIVPINRGLSPQRALSSRITTLLKILELEHQLIPAGEPLPADMITNLNYQPIEELLDRHRHDSIEFLRDSLGDL